MSLRDEILDAVPASAREGILKLALDHNITDPDDPTWAMVSLAWAATQAAATGRQTLDEALGTASKIPDMIYSSTIAAGADLKAGVSQAIEQKTVEAGQGLVQAIGVAAGKGAADLTAAAAGLERMGQEKGAAFVEHWKEELARAAARRERAGLFRASGWLVIGALILFCAGGFAMFTTLAASGKIAPPQISVGWNPVAIYGPSAWEVCPGTTDQTCVRPRLPMRSGKSKVDWFFHKYL